VDCAWKLWAGWQECSQTCGGGSQQRKRDKVLELHGGEPCQGDASQDQGCNVEPCPVDCKWESWAGWGTCTQACGGTGGSQQREREKVPAKHGGAKCMGLDTETKKGCNAKPCPIDCKVGKWTPWSCSKTCGGGTATRARTLTAPQHGGEKCDPEATPPSEKKPCNEGHCPVDCKAQDWSEWGDCSKSCGKGQKIRDRELVQAKHGGKSCDHLSPAQKEACATHPCPVDCVWAHWGKFSECSVSCAGGVQKRNRTVNRTASHGGKACKGNRTGTLEGCNSDECPVEAEMEGASEESGASGLFGPSSSWAAPVLVISVLFAELLLGRST